MVIMTTVRISYAKDGRMIQYSHISEFCNTFLSRKTANSGYLGGKNAQKLLNLIAVCKSGLYWSKLYIERVYWETGKQKWKQSVKGFLEKVKLILYRHEKEWFLNEKHVKVREMKAERFDHSYYLALLTHMEYPDWPICNWKDVPELESMCK